ncbi:MAG: 50S ribosomal protein L10, partial [Bacteroidetes bacterium]
MTRAEKAAVVEELKAKFEQSSFFYITDSSALTVEQVNKLRSMLYEKGIEMRVVKNTLARKAL